MVAYSFCFHLWPVVLSLIGLVSIQYSCQVYWQLGFDKEVGHIYWGRDIWSKICPRYSLPPYYSYLMRYTVEYLADADSVIVKRAHSLDDNEIAERFSNHPLRRHHFSMFFPPLLLFFFIFYIPTACQFIFVHTPFSFQFCHTLNYLCFPIFLDHTIRCWSQHFSFDEIQYIQYNNGYSSSFPSQS